MPRIMRMKLDPTLSSLATYCANEQPTFRLKEPLVAAVLLERLSRCESRQWANDPYARSGAK